MARGDPRRRSRKAAEARKAEAEAKKAAEAAGKKAAPKKSTPAKAAAPAESTPSAQPRKSRREIDLIVAREDRSIGLLGRGSGGRPRRVNTNRSDGSKRAFATSAEAERATLSLYRQAVHDYRRGAPSRNRSSDYGASSAPVPNAITPCTDAGCLRGVSPDRGFTEAQLSGQFEHYHHSHEYINYITQADKGTTRNLFRRPTVNDPVRVKDRKTGKEKIQIRRTNFVDIHPEDIGGLAEAGRKFVGFWEQNYPRDPIERPNIAQRIFAPPGERFKPPEERTTKPGYIHFTDPRETAPNRASRVQAEIFQQKQAEKLGEQFKPYSGESGESGPTREGQ